MMKKIIFCLLLFILACSKIEQLNEVFIKNAHNEAIYIKLDGWQNFSQHKLAFLQHGLASNMEHSAIQTAKQALLDNGYFVVSFDSRYSLGKSDGEVRQASLSTFVDDLTSVIDWSKKQKFYQEPFAISGHSLGGASVIQYAALHPQQINILIPITPVISGELWEKSCMENMSDFCHQWKEIGFYEYKTDTRTAVIPYQLIEDTKSYNALELAPDIKAKTLLIAGEKDIVINPQDIQTLSEQFQAPEKFVLIPQSGHNFETKQNQADLYQTISDFIK